MYELNNINLLGNELITGYSLGAVGYQEVAAYQNDDSHDYGSFRPPTFDEVGGLPYTQRTQDAIMKPFSSATRANVAISMPGITLSSDILKQPDDYSDEESLRLIPEVVEFEHDKIQLFSEVYRVYHECSEQDWDSYDGVPISDKTFWEGVKLIGLLPQDLPPPEIMPEPTGEIAFEWYKDRKHVFVMSVGGKERISYAGLFGSHSQTHGVEYLPDRFPQSIINNVRRLLG